MVPAGIATRDRAFESQFEPPFESQFEHCEESTLHLPPGEVGPAWQRMVDRHVVGPLREAHPWIQAEIALPADGRFKGRVRSGRIGPQRYCRVWASHGHCVRFQRGPSPGLQHHSLALIVSGHVRYELGSGSGSVQAGPGDFVLAKDLPSFAIAHEEAVEAVVLYDPLQREALEHFGSQAIVRRPARSDAAAMASRWIQDACTDRGWQSGLAADSMARVVQTLAWEVMHECPVTTRLRLDRASIEQQVTYRLDDPAFSLSDLADTFHCSIRTLHRVFRRDGEESLERYIQRQRIEACAVRLRSQDGAPAPSLTDMALQFGFSSSSHFSHAFRAHFGVSPSAYRKACEES